MLGDDFEILADYPIEGGGRHITVRPSALVCSRQIDFDLSALPLVLKLGKKGIVERKYVDL